MQLDRVPPRKNPQVPGTIVPTPGVSAFEDGQRLAPGHEIVGCGMPQAVVRHPAGARALLGLLAVCLTLLGQGERFEVDARFLTPSTTLHTYWESLERGDVETVAECFEDPGDVLPFPGMLWFLPPVDSIELRGLEVVEAERGRMVTAYEVRFRPTGYPEEQSFVTTTELVRSNHEWRILAPTGEASMPTWKPYPRAVDI